MMLLLRDVAAVLLGLGLVHGIAQSAPPVTFPPPPGEGPALPDNLINQAEISSGALSLDEIRRAGGLVFTTPFNRFDGLGDGPPGTSGPEPFPFSGARAPLQNDQTTMVRVNGMDAQSCLECHGILSTGVIPARTGIGGHGGINDTPMPGTVLLEVDDPDGNGIVDTTGRTINPPFMFGAGAIELLGKEMTQALQAIKTAAKNAPLGAEFELIAKGVSFGTITSTGGGGTQVAIDNLFGIDEDLVVRPFSRKGTNHTIRDFDLGAIAFHQGMQPVEVIGAGQDDDGDGVTDEVTIGELSALSIFLATTPTPRDPHPKGEAKAGKLLFNSIGCASCHIPELKTESKFLDQSFPEVPTDPGSNVFISIDLSKKPAKVKEAPGGGLRVFLFADLKRHNMGPGLAETTGGDLDPFFTTARLWGIADSGPFMHDGRAATLTEAILAHGGEADQDRINFEALSDSEKIQLLAFLRSLKLPKQKHVDELEEFLRDDDSDD